MCIVLSPSRVFLDTATAVATHDRDRRDTSFVVVGKMPIARRGVGARRPIRFRSQPDTTYLSLSPHAE